MLLESFGGCVLFGVGCVVALLIVVFQRTRRVDEILGRLRALEREVARLTRERSVPFAEIVTTPAAEELHAEPVAEESPETATDWPAPTRPPRSKPIPWSAIDIEAFLGARALGWAAVVLLLFAAAFFFRELIERNLIGPLARVAIGVAVGSAALIAGDRQHRKGWPITCQMLTAAGVVVLYLSVYASFGYYQLLGNNAASVYLILIVALSLALAVRYEAPAIAIMAVVGGLLNPILLSTNVDRYASFFTYLLILNAGVACLLLLRRWSVLSLLVLIGTQALFWLWYEEHFHPSKRTAALFMQFALASIWTAHQCFALLRRYQRSDLEDILRILSQAFFLAIAGYVLLNPVIPEWMGALALGLAIHHTALTAAIIRRRPDDAPHIGTQWSIAMGFVAVVLLLEAAASWVAVGWAVQGLALWWFSLRSQSIPLRIMGFAFLGLAVLRFLAKMAIDGAHWQPFWPIANTFAITGLVIAGCMLAAAILSRRRRPETNSPDFILARIAGLGGLLLVWIILSTEAYDYFQVRRSINNPAAAATLQPHERERTPEEFHAFLAARDQRLARMSQVALSTVWGLYAIVLVTLGLKLPSRPLRWSALILFAVTLAKVLILDMERLPGLYRVAALFGLSVMMGAAAWAYQKVKLSMLVETEERDANAI